MRLGLSADENNLQLAVDLGVKGVPVQAADLVSVGIDGVMSGIRDYGLEVCQVGAFGYNPLSSDVPRQADQARILERAIPLAAETGCPYIVICGGNYHPSGFGAGDMRNQSEKALDVIARTLEPMLTLAETHGAKLSIEPYLKTAINTPERFLALRNRVGSEALKVNIDVTSFYDYQDLLDPGKTVRHVCTHLAGHYGLGHIKEIALAEGFHIHSGLVPLGDGPTDWVEVLRLMAPHMPDDSWLILEHVATSDEARSSLDLLKKAAVKAGSPLF